MRVLRVGTNYPSSVERFYARFPEVVTLSYASHHSAFMHDSVGWANFWSTELRRRGFEAEDVVANAEPLQRQWATENAIECAGSTWLLDIVRAQVACYRPDVLFFNDYVTFTAPFIRELRADCPSIRLVVGWCGAPFRDEEVFKEYDLVLTNLPELATRFRSGGLESIHMHHSFAPLVLDRIIHDTLPGEEFTFVGSILNREFFHRKREELLTTLVQSTPLRFWADIPEDSFTNYLSTKARQFAYDISATLESTPVAAGFSSRVPLLSRVRKWQNRPELPHAINRHLRKRACKPLFGLEMFQLLQRSKISLNVHIDLSSEFASNMRLFEATGVGSCLLTDWKSNIGDLFVPDSEIVTFKSPAECVEKAQYLLTHENERMLIAQAGRRRTLTSHTFAHRAEHLVELISERI